MPPGRVEDFIDRTCNYRIPLLLSLAWVRIVMDPGNVFYQIAISSGGVQAFLYTTLLGLMQYRFFTAYGKPICKGTWEETSRFTVGSLIEFSEFTYTILRVTYTGVIAANRVIDNSARDVVISGSAAYGATKDFYASLIGKSMALRRRNLDVAMCFTADAKITEKAFVKRMRAMSRCLLQKQFKVRFGLKRDRASFIGQHMKENIVFMKGHGYGLSGLQVFEGDYAPVTELPISLKEMTLCLMYSAWVFWGVDAIEVGDCLFNPDNCQRPSSFQEYINGLNALLN